MIPQFDNAVRGRVIFRPYPSFTYAVSGDQIIGNTDGIPAIEQSVFHILSTERYAYAIYDGNYGIELAQYTGRPFTYLQATIEDTLKDALLQDDRITDVRVISAAQTSKDSCLVLFDVICNCGAFSREININL